MLPQLNQRRLGAELSSPLADDPVPSMKRRAQLNRDRRKQQQFQAAIRKQRAKIEKHIDLIVSKKLQRQAIEAQGSEIRAQEATAKVDRELRKDFADLVEWLVLGLGQSHWRVLEEMSAMMPKMLRVRGSVVELVPLRFRVYEARRDPRSRGGAASCPPVLAGNRHRLHWSGRHWQQEHARGRPRRGVCNMLSDEVVASLEAAVQLPELRNGSMRGAPERGSFQEAQAAAHRAAIEGRVRAVMRRQGFEKDPKRSLRPGSMGGAMSSRPLIPGTPCVARARFVLAAPRI